VSDAQRLREELALRDDSLANRRVRDLKAEVERLRDALEWIYAEPEDPRKVQMRARAALDTRVASDEDAAGDRHGREGAAHHRQAPGGEAMKSRLDQSESGDRYLADGEVGYWRECYRDQLTRANAAEAENKRLYKVIDEQIEAIGEIGIANVRLEKEAEAPTVERDQLQDAAGAAMAAIRATDFAKAHRVLYDALHPKPARAEGER
jgi:hypothetical protein